MGKLSLLQRIITPTKHSGAKKNLLNRDGVTSDGVNDDDSSSLSDRQGQERTKRGKKNSAVRLFRRIRPRNNGEEQDGYESDTSNGSTRSTSSSFLRYQNRAIWKRKLIKKSVLQRCRDGSEIPVQDGTKPWPMFDGIYKRQNQLLKKGETGEDIDEQEFSDDEDDSVSSIGSESMEDSPLALPASTFSIGLEDEKYLDKVGFNPIEQSRSAFGVVKTLVGKSPSEDHADSDSPGDSSSPYPRTNSPASTSHVSGIQTTAEKEPARHNEESTESQLNSEPPSLPVDSHPLTGQESGIPTSETPPGSSPSVPQQGGSRSPQVFPTQKLCHSERKSKPLCQKKDPDEENREMIPCSIPRTICYSLRSAIGDGSARQRNSHSLMERRPLRPNGCSVDVSYWSHRGKRNYMEDRFVIEHMGSTSKNEKESQLITLLAVFDGHGGSAASQFCSDWLSSYVRKKNEHFPHNIPLAMKAAFMKVDADFALSGVCDGTTACACTLIGRKVICCNAGDSRAIIVKRDGTAVALSEDHKPDRDDETKRINELGGRVIYWGRWRVEGVLAVSRSIGDARLKPYVTAEPDIIEHDIDEDDMFLVVASDGVWDTMSSDLVAKFVLVNTCKIIDKKLKVDDKLLRWIARQISKRARENGSADNISCIVANLNSN